MKVQQLYTGCLAEAAYYIQSNGEAAIIDPLRDVGEYITLAEHDGAVIKYIFETHFHADFVSGHLELARRTGATIVFGPTAHPAFEAHIATDGELFTLGDVQIKLLHTPGHTMESSSFLLLDAEGKERAVFTGDTLFIGDVGRPDLAVKTDLSREDLAKHLFQSLRNKILTLSDDVIIYPGHGAGSACGKKLGKQTSDTLANQKLFNYALNPSLTEDEFVKAVLDGLVAPPQYFPKNAVLNKSGYAAMDEILDRGLTPLSLAKFEEYMNAGALVLDTRKKEAFAAGHIPGALFIGIDDNFAPWVGALIEDLNQKIVFIAEEGREEEVVIRLSRVGYDQALGHLAGGFDTWANAHRPADQLKQVTAEKLNELYHRELDLKILDVRKLSEFDTQHIIGAINYPLDFIHHPDFELNNDDTYYVHCAGGYRSVIACSILIRKGFKHVVNVQGGFNALTHTRIPLTQFEEVSTDL